MMMMMMVMSIMMMMVVVVVVVMMIVLMMMVVLNIVQHYFNFTRYITLNQLKMDHIYRRGVNLKYALIHPYRAVCT